MGREAMVPRRTRDGTIGQTRLANTADARSRRPRRTRGVGCSENSWSERGGAIMTPSPSWQAPRSLAWIPPPGSSSGTPNRPRTPCRTRSSGPGVICPRSGIPDRFDAWLNQLVVRACIDEARRLRRHRVDVELTPLMTPSVDGLESRIVDRDQIERGFLRLEPEMRAVIVLHHYLDLPLPDVAASLGIPLGTAKSRLHRALALLRAALEADARISAELVEGRPA